MKPAILVVLVSCASSPTLPEARFANRSTVEVVNDRRNVARQPETRHLITEAYQFDGSFVRRVTRAMEVRGHQRSLGVNALDEVPDSTWFTNRIGRRPVTVDEIRAAPGGVGSPEPHKPWTIVSNKIGGMSVGFIIKDSRGEKFILKFDEPGFPETETATHVIVGKLLWACGYNVTEDYVVYLRRRDSVIAPDAKVVTQFGGSRRLDGIELDRMLAQVQIEPGGTIRALASRMLDGKALGGHPAEGVRSDDPNDRIPHERRRELRGAYAIFAWLDHSDVQEGNTLDMWVSDAGDPRRHYVKHYWVDFGKALGVLGTANQDPRRGYEWVFDPAVMLGQVLSLGTTDRLWEHRMQPPLRGIGAYDVRSYDPGAWKAYTAAYVPLLVADDVDKFWAAKILIQLTPEQIRAAVDAGRLTDPVAARYLTDTLIARQRETAYHWFRRIAPLDRFTASTRQLCFEDLGIAYRLEPTATTRYIVTTYDRRTHLLAQRTAIAAQGDGAACAFPTFAAGGDGYTIVRIDTMRPKFHRTTYVHVARDPRTGVPRVIGVYRP